MKSFRNFFLGTVTGVIILGLFILTELNLKDYILIYK